MNRRGWEGGGELLDQNKTNNSSDSCELLSTRDIYIKDRNQFSHRDPAMADLKQILDESVVGNTN